MINYKNCIYVLTNPLYAGYVKIGYASDLNSRLASLNTGMLQNFEVYCIYETDVKNSDLEFHKIITDLVPILRAKVVNGQKVQDKEFFKFEPEQVYDLLQHIAKMTNTENKLYKIKEEKQIESKVLKIQEILDIKLLNDTIIRPMFMEIHDIDIQTIIDGYLGTVSDRIGDELLNFYERKNDLKLRRSHL